ncbi:uncharacterized protein LOC136037697 isoform X1 [Artemia franciscana]|uniref:uncharacterized protein LOC136037697 isoform X1 n=1 Tax=Artemia franciscana TaxID=6661 RepID=UPI0032DA2E9A
MPTRSSTTADQTPILSGTRIAIAVEYPYEHVARKVPKKSNGGTDESLSKGLIENFKSQILLTGYKSLSSDSPSPGTLNDSGFTTDTSPSESRGSSPDFGSPTMGLEQEQAVHTATVINHKTFGHFYLSGKPGQMYLPGFLIVLAPICIGMSFNEIWNFMVVQEIGKGNEVK